MIRLKPGDLVNKHCFVGVVLETGEQELGGFPMWYWVEVAWIDYFPKPITFESIQDWEENNSIKPITRQEAAKLLPDSHIGRKNWKPIKEQI